MNFFKTLLKPPIFQNRGLDPGTIAHCPLPIAHCPLPIAMISIKLPTGRGKASLARLEAGLLAGLGQGA